ncbi:MAG: hypothetical protein WC881_12005 [Elusimicrobiota bacterium]|jgi:hypothetical protein
MKLVLRLLVAALLLPGFAIASSLTNADIIKMSEAKLDESIILTSIESSEPKFDTSAQGLIELSGAKVPQAVISAMIKRNSPPATPVAAPAASAPAAGTSAVMSPSEVFLVDGDETKSMRYLNPQMRTAARGLGFGGFAQYAVLRGVQASARLKNRPTFLISVPDQAQAESYMTLASFAVRKNNTREVMIGGGYMSYSSGVHPDRIIAVDTAKADDQTKAQKGFTIYRVTPQKTLPAGEYAVILYTGEMQSLVSAWFAGTGNAYFDFGVDR